MIWKLSLNLGKICNDRVGDFNFSQDVRLLDSFLIADIPSIDLYGCITEDFHNPWPVLNKFNMNFNVKNQQASWGS